MYNDITILEKKIVDQAAEVAALVGAQPWKDGFEVLRACFVLAAKEKLSYALASFTGMQAKLPLITVSETKSGNFIVEEDGYPVAVVRQKESGEVETILCI